MTIEQIVKDINNKIFQPIYLLMGEEVYYIDKITDYIMSHVLDESEKAFNEHVLYGKDIPAAQIDNYARRFPMMAAHQVIVVKEAQNLKRIDDLVHYASKPLKSTILVINYKYKSLPKNKKLYKEIAKNGLVFESKKLYENQVPDWITTYLKKKGCSIDIPAAHLLTENLGNDLAKISNELDKLLLSLPEDKMQINAAIIERNIGISKDYNNFELQKALGKKDILKVNRIAKYFAENPKEHPFVLTITSLYTYFSKLLIYYFITDKTPKNIASVLRVNPYFVRDYQEAVRNYPSKKLVEIVSILREYDLKSKGVQANAVPQGELLREMLFRIMHP